MADVSRHPLAAAEIKAAEVREHYRRNTGFDNRVVTGFGQTNAGLNITILAGVAIINGQQVGFTTDASVTEPLTANETNHIYVDINGEILVNITGVAPADSLKLYEATTNATVVVGTPTDKRETSIIAPTTIKATHFTATDAAGAFTGAIVDLTRVTPYLRLADTGASGLTARIVSTGGYVQIMNDALSAWWLRVKSTEVEALSLLKAATLGVGGTPDASALADFQSTTKGLRVPTMTEAQRDAIASPAQGLLVYNTDEKRHEVRRDSSWLAIGRDPLTDPFMHFLR